MTALTLLPSVNTPSLRLRELALSDARGFARFMVCPEYQQHLAVRYPSEYAVHQFVARAMARQDRKGRVTWHLAADCRQSRSVIGEGFIIFHEKGVAEIGWGVDPAVWNMGFGSEIAHALVAIAIERLNATNVWCKVKAENAASLRVAAKCGLRQDRVVATQRPGKDDRLESIHIFMLSSEEYFDAAY